jgi:hypothetical protein
VLPLGYSRYTQGMPEVTLPGGNTTGAVLIEGVVHKPASPWTASVHALLRHLEQAGFEAAPRALGFDDQGREMLTYLPGETIGQRQPWPAWASADSMLAQVGRWLRRVHDLTAEVIREMAGAGDAASMALLPIAEMLDRSAVGVQALSVDFWRHHPAGNPAPDKAGDLAREAD